jgi:hypothetical protein
MPIERKIIPPNDAARAAELTSMAKCDFDVEQILKLRSTDSVAPCAAACCIGGRSIPNRRM